MRQRLGFFTTVLLLTAAAAGAAHAQWSSDPAANLALADRPYEQSVPKIAATPDGGAFVGWYDQASGNYDLYLQRLDPSGVELWGHNGIPVSEHPQDTWIMEWHLIADSAGAAVLVFSDIRDEQTYNVVNAYRVGPDGSMLWGPDGIALSDAGPNEMCAGMRVTQASDGDFVVVWTEWGMGRGGQLKMQRVSPEGVLRFAAGGINLAKAKGSAPAFPDLVPADDGSVIVAWLTNNLIDSQSKFLVAQRFDAAGSAVWPGPVTVFDACSLPVAYMPEIRPDGRGGALLAWHYTPWLVYNAAVQHLSADGAELFPHNGVTVATDESLYHYYPAMAYDAATGEIAVFFRQYDSTYGLYGLYVQRFSPQGERLLGDGGKVLVPMGATEVSSPVAMPAGGDSDVFWMERLTWSDVRIQGSRVDAAGTMLWGGQPVAVSSQPSAKGDLQLAPGAAGAAVLVWDDSRNAAVTGQDIYGQKVRADGALGN